MLCWLSRMLCCVVVCWWLQWRACDCTPVAGNQNTEGLSGCGVCVWVFPASLPDVTSCCSCVLGVVEIFEATSVTCVSVCVQVMAALEPRALAQLQQQVGGPVLHACPRGVSSTACTPYMPQACIELLHHRLAGVGCAAANSTVTHHL
jgi:hypothetical protein